MLDGLTLDQLRILMAVAETGSFSAAARRLGRVQSAVSQSIQTLEETLRLTLFDRAGKTPVLTEAGRAVLADARQVVQRADALRNHAESIAGGTEPELAFAVDAMFPTPLLMESLRSLQAAFPCLPVALLTEGLGAAEQRLRDGQARFAIYCLLSTGAGDLDADFLAHVALVPVVAAAHPLAAHAGPLGADLLAQQIQLVLTDRSPLTSSLTGSIYSGRLWRFADLATRHEYLRAGFGWCHMPWHMVAEEVEKGLLKRLHIPQSEGLTLPLHVVRQRGTRLGPAARWLVDDLKARLATWQPCPDDAVPAGRAAR
ncbi:MAG: LysR family transcriptional regulator [Hyphomicrobiaceae bacterium]|nr:LysR family transcriptional regulator [Hyphomicrobiaceae bacterium]